MFSTSLKTRSTSLVLVIFLFAAAVVMAGEVGTSYGGTAAHRQDSSWTLGVPGNVMANSTVQGTVEGGPPAAGGAPPPFSITIELNGWPTKIGTATFNVETGKWEFDIVVPPGSAGSTMRILLIPNNGPVVTKTIKIN